ncbi:FliH/SctL family protein [Hydrogenophaga sp.]|uniref:FliH/SctL family protein n=1 Tax=Hydrogenophaga sp. TaxID=1904254 RepID=UPI00356AEFAB
MTGSSKPSSGSRFIPREEIGAVSAWRFSAMDGSLDDAEQASPLPATDLMEQAIAQAREEALAEGFAQGHAAGSEEMRHALEADMRKTAADASVRMAQLLHNTQDHLQKSEAQISRHILDLACDLARQVVRREIRSDPSHLQPVIAEALAQLIDDGLPATVRMNPADLELMSEGLDQALGNPRPEFVADPAIHPGGCLVESASMAVDATIEKRWSRAVGNLGLDAAWEIQEQEQTSAAEEQDV